MFSLIAFMGLRPEIIRRIIRRRRAFLSIELLIAIGIVAVAALFIFARGNQATRDSNENQLIAQYGNLVQSVRRTFANDTTMGTAGTDLVPTLLTLGTAPREMTRTATLENVYAASTTVVAGTNKTFTTTWTGLPKNACAALAKIEISPITLTVNSSTLTLPVSTSTVATACTQDGSGPSSGNSVAITVSGNG